jgi:Protein of unknown function (DUF3551)
MRILFLTLGILVAVSVLGTRAQAQNYPWCAIYGGGSAGGGRNCGFNTFEQCLATISGIGGTCQQHHLSGPRLGQFQQHQLPAAQELAAEVVSPRRG